MKVHFKHVLIVSFEIHCGSIQSPNYADCVTVKILLDLTVYIYTHTHTHTCANLHTRTNTHGHHECGVTYGTLCNVLLSQTTVYGGQPG